DGAVVVFRVDVVIDHVHTVALEHPVAPREEPMPEPARVWRNEEHVLHRGDRADEMLMRPHDESGISEQLAILPRREEPERVDALERLIRSKVRLQRELLEVRELL